MQRGLHVYGQKPLTHDIYESRKLTEFARKKKLVTQMGIQIHSAAEYRLGVQLIQSGAIGKVRAVHTWSSKKWGDNDPMPQRVDPSARRLQLGPMDRRVRGTSVHRPAAGIIPATGASGSTSAPARSVTWAATSTIPFSRRSRSPRRSASAAKAPHRTITRGQRTPSSTTFSPERNSPRSRE